MAEAKPSIFNKQAEERLRSPDDLDRYLRVTSPSVWVVVFAVLALTLGLLAWGVFGSVSSSVGTNVVCTEDSSLCLLSMKEVGKVHVGDPVYVSGRKVTVTEIDDVPLSREEASQLLGRDYLVDTLMPEDWAYVVTLEPIEGASTYVPLEASITTERVAPISLLLGQSQ